MQSLKQVLTVIFVELQYYNASMFHQVDLSGQDVRFLWRFLDIDEVEMEGILIAKTSSFVAVGKIYKTLYPAILFVVYFDEHTCILTSFWVRAAPKRCSKYTTCGYVDVGKIYKTSLTHLLRPSLE